MLKYKGKEYRNLEEQVQKNLDDIQGLKTGIKIEKSITLAQLPTYTVSSHLGQYFLITDDNEKHLYLIILNNEDSVIAEDLGEYPARGPQGIQGIQGPKGEPGESIRGPQGIQGEQGIRGRPGEGWADLNEIDATPYTPTFTEQANDVKVETSADLITNSGTPNEEVKTIGFKFEVPKNTPVTANPAETGSTDLTKLKVGDTVYNIPSGGGGGGGQIYKHNLNIRSNQLNNEWDITNLVCYTPSSTPITTDNDFYNYRDMFIGSIGYGENTTDGSWIGLCMLTYIEIMANHFEIAFYQYSNMGYIEINTTYLEIVSDTVTAI